jgi:hypothetical protein
VVVMSPFHSSPAADKRDRYTAVVDTDTHTTNDSMGRIVSIQNPLRHVQVAAHGKMTMMTREVPRKEKHSRCLQ